MYFIFEYIISNPLPISSYITCHFNVHNMSLLQALSYKSQISITHSCPIDRSGHIINVHIPTLRTITWSKGCFCSNVFVKRSIWSKPRNLAISPTNQVLVVFSGIYFTSTLLYTLFVSRILYTIDTLQDICQPSFIIILVA